MFASIPSRIPCALLAACAFAMPAAQAFDLTSADLRDHGPLTNEQVLNGFGCHGANRSPQLAWTDPPAGTRSFAVTVYDPDAPTGSGWWHWVVFDIPANVRSLAAGAGGAQAASLPAGARHGRSDFGTLAFGGACPPPGDKPHRYITTVYALKVDKLELPPEPSGAFVGFMIHANQLGSRALTATYGR